MFTVSDEKYFVGDKKKGQFLCEHLITYGIQFDYSLLVTHKRFASHKNSVRKAH